VTFEVPVSAVSRSRGRRGAVAVAGLSVAIVLGGAVAGILVPQRRTAPGPAAAAVVLPTSTPAGARVPLIPRVTTASVARPLPGRIQCHDVGRRECERVVRAALRVLPAGLPDVSGATVWDSLTCNDDFDCPPDYLRDSAAIGSVVIRFADDSPSVSVNVVDWRYGTSIRLGLRAWIARSLPLAD
jgi:hypothetical protein